MNRRSFLRTAAGAAVALPILGIGYGFAEAHEIGIERPKLSVPNLPGEFEGLRIAFLTDIHHGPYTTETYLRKIVRTTLTLQPDLILLGGDYILRDQKHIEPCFEVLKSLKAPLGVFGVLGEHDHTHGAEETRSAMAKAGIVDLTNAGTWLKRGHSKVRLGGVDDLWKGKPDERAALGDCTRDDAAILLCHNPDFVEGIRDRRVGLVFSGHTHGGQAAYPGWQNPFTPSRYGNKYAQGVVDAPATTVYVSRGLGVSGLPVRYNCPAELTLATIEA